MKLFGRNIANSRMVMVILLCGAFLLLTGCRSAVSSNRADGVKTDDPPWVFVSSPDFFNFDIAYPQPKWEAAIDWFLKQVRKENPDFVLVAGDLVNGHWYDNRQELEHLAAVYYGNWVHRMQDYGLTYYAAVGDHELGDAPWPDEKIKLVPLFDKAFLEHLGMPVNGPAGMEGRAYYVLHKNLLLITVETFELKDNQMRLTVSGEQLKWLERVLKEHQNAAHIIVQGHLPIIPGVKSRSSSYLMLEDGTESDFWRVMKKYGVEMYLCGEHHAVTVSEKDGIWQIVHGSSWGRVETINYMVVKVWPEKMELEIKEFPVELKGGNIWNINKPKGPREIVEISEAVRKNGPQVVGTMVIDKTNGTKQFLNRQGVFDPKVQAEQARQNQEAEQARKSVPKNDG